MPDDAAPTAAEPDEAAPPATAAPAESGKVETALERARRLLNAAIRKPPVHAAAAMAPGATPRVDKYFGERLPPVCARLGCYVSDDGKRFYCINPACQKHLKRETKHTRRGNPLKAASPMIYFRCPRCQSRNIEMHVLSNKYVCGACRNAWGR